MLDLMGISGSNVTGDHRLIQGALIRYYLLSFYRNDFGFQQ